MHIGYCITVYRKDDESEVGDFPISTSQVEARKMLNLDHPINCDSLTQQQVSMLSKDLIGGDSLVWNESYDYLLTGQNLPPFTDDW
jgi:hypothetical protein